MFFTTQQADALHGAMVQLAVDLALGAGLARDDDDPTGTEYGYVDLDVTDAMLHAALCLPVSTAAVLADLCAALGIAAPELVQRALGICPPEREAAHAA